jgi:hypothetical protein
MLQHGNQEVATENGDMMETDETIVIVIGDAMMDVMKDVDGRFSWS